MKGATPAAVVVVAVAGGNGSDSVSGSGSCSHVWVGYGDMPALRNMPGIISIIGSSFFL